MIDKATIQRAKGSDLLSDLVTGMQKVAASGGGEYAGPCPFCGGEDRFRVQPASARWLCRHCTDGHWQDAIDFVRRRDNCSFAEAVTVLTGTSADQVNTRHTKRVVGAPTKNYATKAPPITWQAQARAFVEQSRETLWSDAGTRALGGLRGRGFSDDTIRIAGLGWNSRDLYQERAAWSLTGDRKVWLPRGWVIPWRIGSELWRVNIRRPRPDYANGGPKYIGPTGSGNGLYNVDALTLGCNAVLVEGELDALTITQHASDIAVAVATGSTHGARRIRWIARLALADTVLVAYDADEEGQKAADFWLSALPNARRWRPWWEDANRMAVDGADLRAWLAPALTMNKVQRPNASDDHQLLRRRQLEHLLAKPELKEFEQRRVRELAAECGATVRFEWYVFADPMAGWVELTEEDLLR